MEKKMLRLITFIIKQIRDFSKSLSKHNIAAFSGESTLFIIISFFPFTMFLLMLVKHTPLTKESILRLISGIIPPGTSDSIITIINDLYTSSSGTLISISAITLIWSASRGFMSLVRGFNSIYRTAETRGYFTLRIWSFLYTIVFALIIIFSLALLVFGNKIYFFLTNAIPELSNIAFLLISIRVIASLALFIFFFLIMYMVLPNRKSNIVYELPGAILASGGWLGFSYIYSYYINNISTNSYMYGSLSTIVFLMVWLYFCIYIIFIGAAVNDRLRQFISYIILQKKENKEQSQENND